MTSSKLDIDRATKRYGDTIALKPTTLSVAAGEFLTLLGPSGSGKTTLLMMIAGLTEVSGGSIRLDGQDITALPAYRRNIGVIFQNYALFPHLSVFENVAFPLRMRKWPAARIETAVRQTLDLVQLGALGARLPRELSGGQQQRVAFARAIVFEPEIVLMDEPLGALDKKLREELKLEIRKLHRDLGTTVVYVTHDQDEAMLLSDRICLMNQAHVEQIDTPAGLYARPRSRFAAAFVGESNLLDGVVRSGVVEVAGTLFRADPGAGLPPEGSAATILIRPERIALREARPGETRLAGTVRDVIDLGALLRLSVDVGDGLLLDVTMLGGGATPAFGQAVALAVAPEDVVVLGFEAGGR